MAEGGFHCVLGNPPWEKHQLKEEEYFSTRCPAIASASGHTRKILIQYLEKGLLTQYLEGTKGAPAPWEQTLFRQYEAALRLAGAESLFTTPRRRTAAASP